MDFKVKLFDSEHLNEINTRRLKIDLGSFKLHEFFLYLKSLHDIGDAETIYVFWKDDRNWSQLKSEEDWNTLLERCKADQKLIMKLNIYYGNVHINVTCDICGNIVIGDRHKCLQCDDFDICQLCFQAKPNIHKQHCFLLLRTPEDSRKFLRSIPSPYSVGVSDFRVIDVDVDRMYCGSPCGVPDRETGPTAPDTGVETDGPAVARTTEPSQAQGVSLATLSSIPEDYMANLPQNIHEGFALLKSMGFMNMDGPLIALLIEKNGNISDVVEELEYSLKKK